MSEAMETNLSLSSDFFCSCICTSGDDGNQCETRVVGGSDVFVCICISICSCILVGDDDQEEGGCGKLSSYV